MKVIARGNFRYKTIKLTEDTKFTGKANLTLANIITNGFKLIIGGCHFRDVMIDGIRYKTKNDERRIRGLEV